MASYQIQNTTTTATNAYNGYSLLAYCFSYTPNLTNDRLLKVNGVNVSDIWTAVQDVDWECSTNSGAPNYYPTIKLKMDVIVNKLYTPTISTGLAGKYLGKFTLNYPGNTYDGYKFYFVVGPINNGALQVTNTGLRTDGLILLDINDVGLLTTDLNIMFSKEYALPIRSPICPVVTFSSMNPNLSLTI